MENKPTLVMGGSLNPERYSNRAIKSLRRAGHTVYSIGLRTGMIGDVEIIKDTGSFKDIHTITLYLSAKNQKQYYDYILDLKPKRIVYNPGAENDELEELARKNNIENLEACTLVLLATGQY